MTLHAEKKRDIVPSTPSDTQLSLDIIQNVPPDALQTYEERQSTQEAAIHYLMEAIYQQKQEINMLRNQVTMLSQYVLSGSGNPHSQLLELKPPPAQPRSFAQFQVQQQQQRNLMDQDQSRNQNSNSFVMPPPEKPDPTPAFRRHQALGHPSAARYSAPPPTNLSSSDLSQRASTPGFQNSNQFMNSANPVESITSEFGTVTLDEPEVSQYNLFNSGDQFATPHDHMHWI